MGKIPVAFFNYITTSFTIYVLALVSLNGTIQSVAAKGIISDKVRFEVGNGYTAVAAGKQWRRSLPGKFGDVYEVSLQVHNKRYDDISAYVCSARELQKLNQTGQARCDGVNRYRGRISFRAPIRTREPYFLVIDNSFSMILTKKVSYSVVVTTPWPAEAARHARNLFDGFSAEIQRTFKVPKFNVSLSPCGQVNASSNTVTGDIIICTELYVPEVKKRRQGAIIGVMFHELGHSLLSLWGIPGNRNEELVDEFAVVMMYLGGIQERAYEMVEWFQEKDSRREAMAVLHQDSPHPISVQRVRNIRRILQNPRPVVERWNQILYPRMTKAGLQKVLKDTPQYYDRALAERLLASRPDSHGSSGAWGQQKPPDRDYSTSPGGVYPQPPPQNAPPPIR